MKVKVSSKKSNASKEAAPRSASKITKLVFDRHAMIVLPRAPVSKVLDAVRGRELKNTLTKPAFLVTRGPKESKRGVYVSAVMWDGKDLYCRTENNGTKVYGSLKALSEIDKEGFSAAIVNGSALAKMAKEKGDVVTVTHRSEDADITVALLNSFGDRFVGGVMRDGGKLRAVTMEHPTSKNNKDVQFDNPRHVKTNKAKFLAALAS